MNLEDESRLRKPRTGAAKLCIRKPFVAVNSCITTPKHNQRPVHRTIRFGLEDTAHVKGSQNRCKTVHTKRRNGKTKWPRLM